MARNASLSALLFAGAALLANSAAMASDPQSCFADLAATRSYSLGHPRNAEPTRDGASVLYLRSGPRDTALGLYRFDIASGTEKPLALPEGSEHLSVEEKARRERARMTLSGITSFVTSQDGTTVLYAQGDRLGTIALRDNTAHVVPGRSWIAPRLSPDGKYVAAVRDDDLHVIDLTSGKDHAVTTGGTDIHTHGLPEFAASEELDREDGTWWSPDGKTLLVEDADMSGVEPHWIGDESHPSQQPVEFRYPRAGTNNAKVGLTLVSRDGAKRTKVTWDAEKFPYLVRVVWSQAKAPLTLAVMNRAETEQQLLRVDPVTGATHMLLDEHDPAWIDNRPGLGWASSPLPEWLADGSGFLWANDQHGPWRLELHHADGSLDHVLTPQDLAFRAIDDVDLAHGTVTIDAAPNRLDNGIYRLSLKGGAPVVIDGAEGQHSANFAHGAHDVFVERRADAQGNLDTVVRDHTLRTLATLPDHAEAAPTVHATFTTSGKDDLDTVIIRPEHEVAGQKYPVILSVYAGPGVKEVQRSPRQYLPEQCLADHGFIVASFDGRGTPGRTHDWERATKNNLIDLPLADQVEGLQAVEAKYPDIDASRAGVTGWSFGGYFTAMATIRRPDVFKAGVAGAPPVDFADYDTAYTERYLGTPQDDVEGYRKSNVLTYADQLARPLLIMHGLTDDNVYFENTAKLTEALLKAGKPYNLLLLPGTHLLSDPVLRRRVDEARERFFQTTLGATAAH